MAIKNNKSSGKFTEFLPLPYIGMFDLDVIYQASDVELLYKILSLVNDIAESQNTVIDEFNKILEWANSQIETYTKEQLQKWLDDGSFEDLIMKYLEKSDFMDIQTIGAIENEDISDILINCMGKYTTIYIPNKVYKVSKLVSVPSNTKIIGGLLQFDDNVNIEGIFQLSSVENVVFDNVSFDINNKPLKCIFGEDSSNIVINECNFKNTYRKTGDTEHSCIYFQNSGNIKVTNSNFKNCGYYEEGEQETNQMACISNTQTDKERLTVQNCIFDGFWIAIYSSSDTYVSNCTFLNSMDNCFYSSTEHTNPITIENCLFDTNLKDEDLVLQGNPIKIDSCIFNSCGVACINLIKGCDIVKINNCIFNNPSSSAPIYRQRDYTTNTVDILEFTNNVIWFSGSRGNQDYIRLGNTNTFNFIGNTFTIKMNSGFNAIEYDSATTVFAKGVITNNRFSNKTASTYPYLINGGQYVYENNWFLENNIMMKLEYVLEHTTGSTLASSGDIQTTVGVRLFKYNATSVPTTTTNYRIGDILVGRTTGAIYIYTSSGWKTVTVS